MSLSMTGEPAIRPTGLLLLRTRLVVGIAFLLTFLRPDVLAFALRHVMKGAAPATAAGAYRARAHACAVSARCAGQGCLQRSIAVVLLCRLAGTSPVWKTGYRVAPFAAHAWVEVEGRPVAEPGDVSSYTTVIEVCPRAQAPAETPSNESR